MITADQLTKYVSANQADADFVRACLDEAEQIVANALLSPAGTVRTCPEEIRDRAVKEVGAELFARRGLRNGIATFGTGDGDLQPVRVARDPMHLARSILAPWAGGPFA